MGRDFRASAVRRQYVCSIAAPVTAEIGEQEANRRRGIPIPIEVPALNLSRSPRFATPSQDHFPNVGDRHGGVAIYPEQRRNAV
jgi:hypothetical protein